MKKQLKYITPLRAGIVLGVLYGLLALIVAPFFLLASLVGKAGVSGVFVAILLPLGYAVVGFVGGIIIAALYNLIAKWTGGIEFEVSHVAPPAA